ncbi:hypothetical protein HUJ05_006775 [Dendroctonus ponderosae]|nr:hypothetical protein HUJ05_006775 [Dendroctonus ponderosae]
MSPRVTLNNHQLPQAESAKYLGIPYALHQAGFGFGVLLLVLVAYITDYSLILMIKAGHISGRFSYQGIMEAAFGRAGYILLGILQFVYPFIAMVSYNVVVGDTVTKVIIRLTDIEPDNIFAKREIIVLIATIFITVPLSLYRDIAKLAKISFFSLCLLSLVHPACRGCRPCSFYNILQQNG